MPSNVILAAPGEVWLNETSQTYWQLMSFPQDLWGSCLQYHTAIATMWHAPFRKGCKCLRVRILPGETSLPCVDFRDLLREMTDSEHDEVMGRENWQLLTGKLAKWEDIVTPHRVREFNQVVAREKLTIAEMVAVGIDRKAAETAWNMVHTPAHEKMEADLKRAAAYLRDHGYSDEQIVTGMAERITPRITGIRREFTVQFPDTKAPEIPDSSPSARVIAGHTVLERIRRGTATAVSMPDFFGSCEAMELWVRTTFPATHHLLTAKDWSVLVATVEAQEEQREVFRKLMAGEMARRASQ